MKYMYTHDFNRLKVNLVVFRQKNGAPNVIATARMKFASEVRPSQYMIPFGNTEPSILVYHYLDTLWILRVGT